MLVTMSDCLQLLLSTDSPEELACYVVEHAPDWIMYLHNLNQYMSMLKEEVSSSQIEILNCNAIITFLYSNLIK